jgi:tripartite-type tricarboxylate transporter receptor subunit TctC
MMRTHVIQYRLRTAGALAAAMLACAPRVASTQPADQFFKGKVINLYIGFAAGGSYDYYARLVARFIGKNIPGNPTVVAQTMADAGSFQAANFLFAAAPRDGTAMGIITQIGDRGRFAFASGTLQGERVHLDRNVLATSV